MGLASKIASKVTKYISPEEKVISPKEFKKTRKAYKLFIRGDDEDTIFPLFVDTAKPVTQKEYIRANFPEETFKGKKSVKGEERYYVPTKSPKRTKGEKAKNTGDDIIIPDEETRKKLIDAGFITNKKERTTSAPFGKVTAVAARPGWHASKFPTATHIGPADLKINKEEVEKLLSAGVSSDAIIKKDFVKYFFKDKKITKEKYDSLNKKDKAKVTINTQTQYYIKRRSEDHVFAEIEMPDDVDYQSMLEKEGKKSFSDRIPVGGSYPYSEGQADSKQWFIGGDMKVDKLLSRKDVSELQKELGVTDLPYRDEVENILGRKFNRGGTVALQEQMSMFDEGGMLDEGDTVDPVSGNDVPVGALKEEVRDDVDAKVSPGEYVVSAATVRYHGLDTFMKLRDEAIRGMARMESIGQMGNSDDAELDPDTPFSQDDLVIVMGGKPEDGEPMKANRGGSVLPTPAELGEDDPQQPAFANGGIINPASTSLSLVDRSLANQDGDTKVPKFNHIVEYRNGQGEISFVPVDKNGIPIGYVDPDASPVGISSTKTSDTSPSFSNYSRDEIVPQVFDDRPRGDDDNEINAPNFGDGSWDINFVDEYGNIMDLSARLEKSWEIIRDGGPQQTGWDALGQPIFEFRGGIKQLGQMFDKVSGLNPVELAAGAMLGRGMGGEIVRQITEGGEISTGTWEDLTDTQRDALRDTGIGKEEYVAQNHGGVADKPFQERRLNQDRLENLDPMGDPNLDRQEIAEDTPSYAQQQVQAARNKWERLSKITGKEDGGWEPIKNKGEFKNPDSARRNNWSAWGTSRRRFDSQGNEIPLVSGLDLIDGSGPELMSNYSDTSIEERQLENISKSENPSAAEPYSRKVTEKSLDNIIVPEPAELEASPGGVRTSDLPKIITPSEKQSGDTNLQIELANTVDPLINKTSSTYSPYSPKGSIKIGTGKIDEAAAKEAAANKMTSSISEGVESSLKNTEKKRHTPTPKELIKKLDTVISELEQPGDLSDNTKNMLEKLTTPNIQELQDIRYSDFYTPPAYDEKGMKIMPSSILSTTRKPKKPRATDMIAGSSKDDILSGDDISRFKTDFYSDTKEEGGYEDEDEDTYSAPVDSVTGDNIDDFSSEGMDDFVRDDFDTDAYFTPDVDLDSNLGKEPYMAKGGLIPRKYNRGGPIVNPNTPSLVSTSLINRTGKGVGGASAPGGATTDTTSSKSKRPLPKDYLNPNKNLKSLGNKKTSYDPGERPMSQALAGKIFNNKKSFGKTVGARSTNVIVQNIAELAGISSDDGEGGLTAGDVLAKAYSTQQPYSTHLAGLTGGMRTKVMKQLDDYYGSQVRNLKPFNKTDPSTIEYNTKAGGFRGMTLPDAKKVLGDKNGNLSIAGYVNGMSKSQDTFVNSSVYGTLGREEPSNLVNLLEHNSRWFGPNWNIRPDSLANHNRKWKRVFGEEVDLNKPMENVNDFFRAKKILFYKNYGKYARAGYLEPASVWTKKVKDKEGYAKRFPHLKDMIYGTTPTVAAKGGLIKKRKKVKKRV